MTKGLAGPASGRSHTISAMSQPAMTARRKVTQAPGSAACRPISPIARFASGEKSSVPAAMAA